MENSIVNTTSKSSNLKNTSVVVTPTLTLPSYNGAYTTLRSLRILVLLQMMLKYCTPTSIIAYAYVIIKHIYLKFTEKYP